MSERVHEFLPRALVTSLPSYVPSPRALAAPKTSLLQDNASDTSSTRKKMETRSSEQGAVDFTRPSRFGLTERWKLITFYFHPPFTDVPRAWML